MRGNYFVDYTGLISGYLVAIRKTRNKDKWGRLMWLCRCNLCGNYVEMAGFRIKNKERKSCGCFKDGRSADSLYGVWAAKIKKNCTRGWRNFYTFKKEVGEDQYPKILRKKYFQKPYGRKNFKWVSREEYRDTLSFATLLKYKGESHSIRHWANKIGISPQLLHNRIYKLGWSIDKAISTPKRKHPGWSR